METDQQLLRLMTLLSPVFPVGSFSYSHGIEQAVHEQLMTNANEFQNWITGLLNFGSAHNDIIFLSCAWQAVEDKKSIIEINDLSIALCASKEREMETLSLGQAFLSGVELMEYKIKIEDEKLTYPVAVGMIAALMKLNLLPTVSAYLHAFVSNLIQIAIRLNIFGQKDGIKLMHHFENPIFIISSQCETMNLSQIGTSCFMSDIMSMRHETLYSRIFRS